jgi:hypothetical protein
MLDALLSRLFGGVLESVGGRLSAPALAMLAFAAGLAAVPLIALHYDWIGLGAFLASRIVWSLSAHGRGNCPAAPVLQALNFAAMPYAFALGSPAMALAAVLMMFGLVAQAMTALKFGRGWIGSTELFIAIALVCLFPGWFGIVAYVTSVACFVAAGVQLGASWRSS